VKPFEIYSGTHDFNGCADERPWLIFDSRQDNIFGCFPISTKNYRDEPAVWLDPDHADFQATGLNRGCYILVERIMELGGDELRRYRGILTNDLLGAFYDASGYERPK